MPAPVFIEWLFRGGIALLELIHNLQDAVAPHDGIIDQEFEGRCVFQHHRPAYKTLDAFAMLEEQGEASFLLFGIAQNADEYNRRMQVAGDLDVIDGNQAGIADSELTADDLTDLALQELAHPG
jgi:hypothetical protein